MHSWSVPRGWRVDNRCREVRGFKSGEGYRAWSWDEINGAKTDLREDLWAVGLALYTGQRRGWCECTKFYLAA
jgi:hypothetical protein